LRRCSNWCRIWTTLSSFDTAPTGHTLRLLQFPSTLEKGLGKMMSLRNKFGGLISQVSRMFGAGEEFGENALMSKLEGIKSVIEQVNDQFRDPDLTTFICVCIPEFLSLYETERLVQELARFEIDTHNIIINQVLFEEDAMESRLLQARVRMQQKYIDQFHELYEDFHIIKLPLLPEEVRGTEALRSFAVNLTMPYRAGVEGAETERIGIAKIQEMETETASLRAQVSDLQSKLEKQWKGKDLADM